MKLGYYTTKFFEDQGEAPPAPSDLEVLFRDLVRDGLFERAERLADTMCVHFTTYHGREDRFEHWMAAHTTITAALRFHESRTRRRRAVG